MLAYSIFYLYLEQEEKVKTNATCFENNIENNRYNFYWIPFV